jgi:hypothetical protein
MVSAQTAKAVAGAGDMRLTGLMLSPAPYRWP